MLLLRTRRARKDVELLLDGPSPYNNNTHSTRSAFQPTLRSSALHSSPRWMSLQCRCRPPIISPAWCSCLRREASTSAPIIVSPHTTRSPRCASQSDAAEGKVSWVHSHVCHASRSLQIDSRRLLAASSSSLLAATAIE